jgi:hypothetical protein
MPPNPSNQGLANWRFKDDHVQPALDQSKFISFESCLISAGPPQLTDLAAAATGTVPDTDSRTIAVYPIGLIENFTTGQGQSVNKLFEIGSVRSYLFAGRPDGQASFQRILFHGPSALRSIFASYKDANNLFGSLIGNSAPGTQTIKSGNIAPGTISAAGQPDHSFWFNLQNILFRNSFGLLLYMKDTAGTPYAGLYYENAMITQQGFGISAGTVSVMEQISLTYERISPVNVRFVVGG